MKNIFKSGNVVTVVAAAAEASGDYVLFSQNLQGAAANTAAIGEDLELNTCGTYEFAMAAGTVVSVGDKMLWDVATATFNNGAAAGAGVDVYAGVAVRAQTNAELVCLVKLFDRPETI